MRMHSTLLLTLLAATASRVNGGATTFVLNYDSIVSPQVWVTTLKQAQTNDVSSTHAKEESVLYKVSKEISIEMATDVIQALMMTSENKKEFSLQERTLDLDQRCYEPRLQGFGGDDGGGGATKCSIDYIDDAKTSLVSMSASFYWEKEDDEVGENTEGTRNLGVQLDVEVSSRTTDGGRVAKETLVSSIPKLHKRLGTFNGISWTVRQRQSARGLKSARNSVDSFDEWTDAWLASVDYQMLSDFANLQYLDRMRIFVEENVEVWQYKNPLYSDPVRSLYINGILQSTTAPEGAAHAEALIHPMMVAMRYKSELPVPEPVTALLVSIEPTAALREILKHNNVGEVIVVGADPLAMETTRKLLWELDDCGFLGGRCTELPIVTIVNEPMKQWVNKTGRKDEVEAQVVFIDVPMADPDYLDGHVIRDIRKRTQECAEATVVAMGSTPSLGATNEDMLSSAKLEDVVESLQVSNFPDPDECTTIVNAYDEPLAQPLVSAFFATLYVCDVELMSEAKTYTRFVRMNRPAIEIDFVHAMKPGIGQIPTTVFDSSAHVRYQMLSRAWQDWYCRGMGKDMVACEEFLPKWYNASNHRYDFEVRVHPVKGRSLYATKDIEMGQFVLPHDAAMALRIDPQRWDALDEFIETFPHATLYKDLQDFVHVYGYEIGGLGITGWAVSIACNTTFTNHACSDTEVNVAGYDKDLFAVDGSYLGFSPPLARFNDLLAILVEARRHIVAGEEILQDYATFRDAVGTDANHNDFIAKMCSDGVGLVKDDEDQPMNTLREAISGDEEL